MTFLLTSGMFALGLFAGIILMIELGRLVGARQRARLMEGGAAGVGVVEAATFGLLGLMIAFTFLRSNFNGLAPEHEMNLPGTLPGAVQLRPCCALTVAAFEAER